MKKNLTLLIVLALLAGLSLIAINLFYFPRPDKPLTSQEKADSDYLSAMKIVEKKCLSCHSKGARLPVYAKMPGADKLIQHDIDEGLALINLEKELRLEEDHAISETALAKLETILWKGGMPPAQYLLMHWDSFLTAGDKETLLNWIYRVREEHYAISDTAPEFKHEIVQPLPRSVDLDTRKVLLGNTLYHDIRLSKDNSLSCASCHDLHKGGTDLSKSSTGIGGAIGPINAPTTFNSEFQFKQFWDGRAADLKEQAGGPVHNPIEMGSNWPEVIEKLSEDLDFVQEFTAVYPDGLTGDNIADAIAEFERSLLTPDSRFDRYLRGDKTALSPEAAEGYGLFKAKGCVACHVGKLLGGQSFEKMGAHRNYFRREITEADYGRYNATKDPADQFRFKVPTLRNIALTAPYFHDGSTYDLHEAVKIMGAHQIKEGLSEDEVNKLVLFLESLTGEYQGKSLEDN